MTYRLAPAPHAAGMRSWDCCRCEHEELRRPVFLAGPGGVVAAGTRCAAVMLGLAPDTATDAEARKVLRPVVAEFEESQRKAHRAAMYAKTADWHAWLETNAPGLPGTLERIHALGGLTAAKAAYRAQVAQ